MIAFPMTALPSLDNIDQPTTYRPFFIALIVAGTLWFALLVLCIIFSIEDAKTSGSGDVSHAGLSSNLQASVNEPEKVTVKEQAGTKFLEGLGQTGDSFGILNSLLTAITMAGAVYTVLLQTKQLKVQQDQIAHQSTLALEQQAHELRQFHADKLERLYCYLQAFAQTVSLGSNDYVIDPKSGRSFRTEIVVHSRECYALIHLYFLNLEGEMDKVKDKAIKFFETLKEIRLSNDSVATKKEKFDTAKMALANNINGFRKGIAGNVHAVLRKAGSQRGTPTINEGKVSLA